MYMYGGCLERGENMTKKFMAVCLTVALSISMALTGCTSRESNNKTVESYVLMAKETGALDSYLEAGSDLFTIEIDATDDTLIYKTIFKDEIGSSVEDLKTQFQEAIGLSETVYISLAQKIAEELGRDTVTISVGYYLNDGTEIVSVDFKNK